MNKPVKNTTPIRLSPLGTLNEIPMPTLLLELLENPGSVVRIERGIHSSGLTYVDVTDDWTEWTVRQYIGPDLHKAIKVAVKARRAVKNPPHTGGSPAETTTERESNAMLPTS